MATDSIQQSKLIVGFNPNDLYYYASPERERPDQAKCAELGDIYASHWNDDCTIYDTNGVLLGDSSAIPYRDASYNCRTRQLCVNKDKSDKLLSIQNSHSGADEKYINTSELYNAELTNTYNLAIGIIMAGTLIYYNK